MILVVWLVLVPATRAQESSVSSESDRPVLTVYTYASFTAAEGPGPPVEAAFETRCRCDLRFVSVDRSTSLLGKMKREGETSAADVVLGLDNSQGVEAQNTGLMTPHKVDIPTLDLPGQWTNPHFLPFGFGFVAFIYDETRLESPPDSFEALLQADDHLKIVIQDPRSTKAGLGLLLWVKALYDHQAADAWKRLTPKMLAVTKVEAQAFEMLLEGEADMVLSHTTSPAEHQAMDHASRFRAAPFEEGHGIQIEVVGMLKNAPNPELAREFLEFTLTPTFQSLIATRHWMYPVVFPEEGLPAAFGPLIRPTRGLTIDAQGVTNNRLDWLDEFNQALNQ